MRLSKSVAFLSAYLRLLIFYCEIAIFDQSTVNKMFLMEKKPKTNLYNKQIIFRVQCSLYFDTRMLFILDVNAGWWWRD